jgi:hypothetical protein
MDFTSEYGQPFLEDKPSKLLVIEKVPARSYIRAGFFAESNSLTRQNSPSELQAQRPLQQLAANAI